ncbi:hypothetical protein CTI12_AA251610 [Artemisia annua]|uniref:Uncharacterized protein n=1 Tax=Artemisia annua TaxID=35608 RepID=A0A2U1NM69_ARTAN|nr:hypothetical protein CTI12_AA251610 [Artemisia annua]
MQLCMSRMTSTKMKIVESSETVSLSDGLDVEVKLEDGLLSSPLVRQIDELDDDVRYKRTSTLKITEHRLTFGSPQERQNGKIVPEDLDYGPKLLQNADSRLPDASLYYQGTLQCSWKDGFPHYTFTAEKRKVYITSNLIKVEPCSDKNVDYVYVFHSRAKKSTLLGEMSVSTSSELCPHGTQMTETKFVLCANGDSIGGYSHTSDHTQEKKKGLSKMAKIFKCNSYKQRISAMQENGVRISSSNVEFAAIIMKDCIRESQEDVAVGGWGLKFLRKDGDCESCKESTGINVIVPAGFHGGPRIGNDGDPSSLVERWKSGGSCDCGGWDLGCPLTVLHAPLNCNDGFEESVSFDLFVQGGKQSGPVLKMVDVNDGAYDLRYKSVLSPLQALSIAVAAIHIRSPILRPMKHDNLLAP